MKSKSETTNRTATGKLSLDEVIALGGGGAHHFETKTFPVRPILRYCLIGNQADDETHLNAPNSYME